MMKGVRLRQYIRIIPGVKINLSKSGASLSVGGKGLTYNIGRKGRRTTLGIPGTGASYSTYDTHAESKAEGEINWGKIVFYVGALVMLAFLIAKATALL